MKAPVDYLDAPVFHLTYPTGEDAAMVPVVTYDDALRAVETALADAEKYRYLLMRALRRSQEENIELPLADTGAPVRPLYPETDLAA